MLPYVFINEKRAVSHISDFLKETGLTANLPQKKNCVRPDPDSVPEGIFD